MLHQSPRKGVFVCFSESRSFHCNPQQACLITSIPKAFLIHTRKKNRKSCSGRIKKKRRMSISLLIQLGGGSVGDKASVIYHGEGNTQYRAMLIRVPSPKQWLWEAVLPQIVSAEICAYERGYTWTLWEELYYTDRIPTKTQARWLLTVKKDLFQSVTSSPGAVFGDANMMCFVVFHFLKLYSHAPRNADWSD